MEIGDGVYSFSVGTARINCFVSGRFFHSYNSNAGLTNLKIHGQHENNYSGTYWKLFYQNREC